MIPTKQTQPQQRSKKTRSKESLGSLATSAVSALPSASASEHPSPASSSASPKKVANIITLPNAGDLALPLGQSLAKLPTDAVHNHLHQVVERAKTTRENLESIELSALILCAVELEYLKGNTQSRNGLPWKTWVKDNCEFTYMTATRYHRVLEAARSNQLPGLRPDALPDLAPSLMSGDQLQDACKTLAASLQGIGGIRQLYLTLDIIAQPKPKLVAPTADSVAEALSLSESAKSPSDPNIATDLDTADAIATYRMALEALDKAHHLKHHRNLPQPTLHEMIETLTFHREELKALIAKS